MEGKDALEHAIDHGDLKFCCKTMEHVANTFRRELEYGYFKNGFSWKLAVDHVNILLEEEEKIRDIAQEIATKIFAYAEADGDWILTRGQVNEALYKAVEEEEFTEEDAYDI